MREVGSESSVSGRAGANRMTIDAGGALENQPSGGCGRVVFGKLLLLLHPAIELLWRIRVNAQQHFRVLGPAVSPALSQEQAGAFRLNPHRIDFVGNEINFSHQTRHPKTVDDIRSAQIEEGWQSAAALAHRDVKFIGGDDAKFGIANLPPPLLADDLYVQR